MAFIKSGGFMKIKVLSIIFVIISCVLLFLVPVSASDEFQFTVDVNERYTDISYVDETNALGEVISDEEDEAIESKKNTYIVILSVLLVVSVIILIVTLKKAKEDKLLPEEEVTGTRD